MDHRFLSSWQKLDRAQEHIESTQAEMGRVLKDNPWPVDLTLEFDAESSSYLVSVARIADLGRCGAIIGDAVTNLRAALDHSVWQLVKESGLSEPTDRTQFPICDTPEAWNSALTDRLKGVPAAELAVIESYQPKERGKRTPTYPLAALRRLSNQDKHRILIPALALPVAASAQFNAEGMDLESVEPLIELRQSLKVGAPLFRVRVTNIQPERQLAMPGNLSIQPSFEDGTPIHETLRNIRALVASYLGKLEAVGGRV
jgi:hypothetical protein